MDTVDHQVHTALPAASVETLSPAQRALLERIQAFSFDDGAPALPFADRLARENDWSPRHAQRAIEEYRRFIFLATVAGHPVTPSDQVDQVWHLHLLYTRLYWSRFCAEVLQHDLHHQPTVGGPEEGRKFARWYERTLASYRQYFGDPPSDIWPAAAIRFGDDIHHVRVNLKRNIVVSKTQLRCAMELGTAAILALLLIASSWMS
jgi:hypothetical protein